MVCRQTHDSSSSNALISAAVLRRFRDDARGIAALEFALILPLMLMIYLGLVEMSRGLRASQRLDLVAHTLSDLTARQLTGGSNTGQAGLSSGALVSIFSAAEALASPLPLTTLKMTVSEINITGTPTSAPTSWQAKPNWTVTYNSSTQRACNVVLTTSSASPVTWGALPPTYTTVSASGVAPVTGPLIVADLTYTYTPVAGFDMAHWASPPNISMARTSYSPVRNTYAPPHIQIFMTADATSPGGMTIHPANCNGTP